MMADETHDLIRHYRTIREADRLFAGPGQLELERTRELLARYLPPPPARILDVGGGPGVYAEWLARRGYDVDLIDPVPEHVQQAQRRFEGSELPARARLGDGRALDFDDNSRDAVLVMGPMYHLTDRADRIQAVSEASRVLRPDGVTFIAAISRLASLLDGFSRGLVRDQDFVAIMKRDLTDGQHRNPTDVSEYFTTAYFHTPEELADEIARAGLTLEAILAVEGPFWCLPGFDEMWDSEPSRRLMLDSLRRVESEPSLLGASAHWLAIARRPAQPRR